MVQTLLIDDVPESLECLRACVEGIAGIEISGQVGSVFDAILELDRRRPDLILCDQVIPGQSTQELADLAQERGIALIWVTGVQGRAGALAKPDWKTLGGDRTRFEAAIRALKLT